MCDGNDNCVQCVKPSNCPNPNDPCVTTTCNANVCGTVTGQCTYGQACGIDSDCSTGHCVGGTCGALPLVTTSGITSLTTDGSLATLATHVYWTGGSSVYRVGVSGTIQTTIATDTGGATLNVLVEGTNVYWGDSTLGEILTAPVTSTNATGTEITNTATAAVVWAGYLYWLDPFAYQIGAYDLSTMAMGSPLPLPMTDGGSPVLVNLATNGSELFFSTDASAATIYLDQGYPPYPVYSGAAYPHTIIADSTNVYWIDDTSIVRSAALPSSTTKTSYVTSANSIATDGTYLYVARSTGDIVKVTIATPTTMTTLATGQTGASTVALDSANIYWSTSNGAILMMRR